MSGKWCHIKRARDLGIPFDGKTGDRNAITDVEGVRVGHETICEGDGRHAIRTGATAILANKRVDDVFAATFRQNENGEMTGTHIIEELGYLTSPVMLTNTISVGTVHDAVVQWSLVTRGEEGAINLPVVAETWDGELNDIYGFHVTAKHVFIALDKAVHQRPKHDRVEEGNVGGGTGMIAHQFKGGIGTSSRVLPESHGRFVIGVLVQANYGDRCDFRVAGVPVGRELTGWKPRIKKKKHGRSGSIIVVVATNAPLLPHQLKRVAKRLPMGLARNGSYASTYSGDLFLAFSTAPIARDSKFLYSAQFLNEYTIDEVFRATIQATEEAIINAMVAAEDMTGIRGNFVYALPHPDLQNVLDKYGRLQKPCKRT